MGDVMIKRKLFTIFAVIQIYSIILTLMTIVYTGYVNLRSERHTDFVEINHKIHEQNANGTIELEQHDDWIHIGQKIYLYSAYWESRSDAQISNFVRVLGIIPVMLTNEDSDGLQCLLWYEDQIKATIVQADFEFLVEYHTKPVQAVFIICTPPTTDTLPYAVSIQPVAFQDRPAVGPPNPIPVRQPTINNKTINNGKIVLCVKATDKLLNDTLSIAEFVSYYKIVGVSHFVFFRVLITSKVWRFIQKIASKLDITVDLLPWNLWTKAEDVCDNARVISINDCVYRYMYRYEFMVTADLDEYLAPKRNNITLQRLLKFTEKHHNQPISTFNFINTLYCLEYKANENRQLMTQRYTRMNRMKWQSGYLSKYIIRPHLVIEVGYYRVQRRLPYTSIVTVKKSYGYLHHYTSCKRVSKDRKITINLNDWKNYSFVVNFREKLLNSSVFKLWKDENDE